MRRIWFTLGMMAQALGLLANDQYCIPDACNTSGFWLDASFIYWSSKEDGLNVAESAQVDSTATTVFASNPKVFQQEFGYHPGFKLGAGFFCNDWDVYAEYTYYRGQNHVSRNAPEGSVGVGVWNVDSWYLQKTFFSNQSLTGTSLSSNWKLALDMGDLLISCPINRNECFDIAFFGGLRTVWIRQQMNLKLNVAAASFGGSSFLGREPRPVESKNKSDAWGIGPRLGLDGKYNLPMGFNVNGSIGGALLYTRFTDVRHSEGAAATFYETPAPLHMSYNCVRPELDLSLGLGWETCICNNQRLGFDISYDFTYFWGQNIMRSLMDEYVAGTSSGSLDLYFQGITLKAIYSF